MARQKLVLTYQDYLKMPDDRTRKEIVGGELHVTAAPSPAHQRVVVNLASIFTGHVRNHHLGEVLVSPLDVVLSQIDIVQPDIVFIDATNAHIVGEAAIHGSPDLVVEVLSPSTLKLDRERKMGLYARAGVREYWIVNSDDHAIEVYKLAGSAYRRESGPEGDVVRSDLFPGLTIALHDIWN